MPLWLRSPVGGLKQDTSPQIDQKQRLKYNGVNFRIFAVNPTCPPCGPSNQNIKLLRSYFCDAVSSCKIRIGKVPAKHYSNTVICSLFMSTQLFIIALCSTRILYSYALSICILQSFFKIPEVLTRTRGSLASHKLISKWTLCNDALVLQRYQGPPRLQDNLDTLNQEGAGTGF